MSDTFADPFIFVKPASIPTAAYIEFYICDPSRGSVCQNAALPHGTGPRPREGNDPLLL